MGAVVREITAMPRFQFNLRAMLIATVALSLIFAAASRQWGFGVIVATLVAEAYAAAWGIRKGRDPVKTAILGGFVAMTILGLFVEIAILLQDLSSIGGMIDAIPQALVATLGILASAVPVAALTGVIVGMAASLSVPLFQSQVSLVARLRSRLRR